MCPFRIFACIELQSQFFQTFQDLLLQVLDVIHRDISTVHVLSPLRLFAMSGRGIVDIILQRFATAATVTPWKCCLLRLLCLLWGIWCGRGSEYLVDIEVAVAGALFPVVLYRRNYILLVALIFVCVLEALCHEVDSDLKIALGGRQAVVWALFQRGLVVHSLASKYEEVCHIFGMFLIQEAEELVWCRHAGRHPSLQWCG
mmetsp:Transcript_11972/g.30163  ORF Transcript_11972/g.30163 Transcript_11972/m.30163 type:complete len:201 (-) Transcript_11972:1-603(-)